MPWIVLLACTVLFSLDLAKCLGCIKEHSGQLSGGVVTFNEFWLKCLVESIIIDA